MKKALVLGGSGFIGGNLVEILEKRNYQVSVFDIKKPDGFIFKGTFFQGDILNYLSLETAIKLFKPSIIFDCSGILGTAETFSHIQKTVDVNIKGTINTLEAVKKFKTPMIYLGLTNRWLNPYTITKRAADKFCLMYAKEFNMKVAVLKALNGYGPRQHWKKVRKIAPTFITLALENKPLIINGSGNQVVDLVHTDDISEMLIRMYEMGTCWGKSIDGGTGIPITVNEVAERIIELAGSKSKIIHQKMRKGEPEVSVTLANPAPVCQLLKFRRRVSFDDGMKKTIEWYRKNYKEFDNG